MLQGNPRDHGALGWLPLVLLLPLAVAALVDVPRVLQWGSVSVLGVLALAQAAVAIAAALLTGAYPRRLVWYFMPFGLFLLWMFGRSTLAPWTQSAVQNGVAYLLFGSQFLIAGTLAAKRPRATVAVLRRGFLLFDVITIPLVLFCLLQYGLPVDADDRVPWIIGPRSVALAAIAPLSWHLSGWCHGQARAGARALLWLLVVVASLSRTATAIALLSAAMAGAAHAWLNPRRLARKVPAFAVVAVVLAGLLVTNATTFRARFFEGYNNVEVGGFEVSTSGRDIFWPRVIESAMQHPILGGGLGSSQAALSDFDATVGHPHNDYLRVWHDGGIPGLCFLLLGLFPWARSLWRQWVSAIRARAVCPELDFAALLTLMGVMLAALTDNPLVYSHVMAPAGVVIGSALGFRAYNNVSRSAGKIARVA